jgi:hypothetical protein
MRAIATCLTGSLVLWLLYSALSWGTYSYTAARNYREGFNFSGPFLLFFYGIWVILFLLIAARVCSRLLRSKAPQILILSSAGLVVLVSLVTHQVGTWLWEREYQANCAYVDSLIERLEGFRTEHGDYPKHLAELNPPPNTILARGDATVELNYSSGANFFTIHFNYGWYDYRYDSATKEWDKRD